MVVQKTIDTLKDRPKDDRVVVAGSVATTVVVILFVAWGYWFIKKIQRGQEQLQIGGGAQDEFNFSSVREAQERIRGGVDTDSDLLQLREEAAARASGYIDLKARKKIENTDDGSDQFGTPDNVQI